MGRRTRVQYSLNSGDIKTLSDNDIKMILRAADELISIGGRNMLVKILKGSKDKKVLEYKLDECPAYGFYKSLTMEEISFRVDWMIKKDYIRLDYNGRLPMLIFSEKGWAIEEETFAEEIYQKFYRDLKQKKPEIISEMKDVNRQVVLVPPSVNTPIYSTRYLRQKHACKASRSAHYAVALQTHL